MMDARILGCDSWVRRYHRKPRDHPFEFTVNFDFEIRFDLIDLREFGEGPAAIAAKMIHPRHPGSVQRWLLLLCVLAPVSFDLNDEVERIVWTAPVIHAHDEVGSIF